MSYYRPSFSQTLAMTRGRGFSSSRGSRGSSWGGERGRGYGSSRGGPGRFSSSFSSSFESRKYPSSAERYSSRGHDDYRKPYRSDGSAGGYMGRDSHRSPERKRMRTEAPSSHRNHDGYGGGDSFISSSRYEPSGGFSERRSFSSDRRPALFARRDEFRKPSGPPSSSSPRGGYRGRISSRGSRGARFRESGARRRLIERSYAVRRRIIPSRTDYARRLRLSKLRSAAIRRTLKKPKKSEKGESSDEKEENWLEETEEKKIKKEGEEVEDEKTEEDKEKVAPVKKKEKEEEASDKEEKKSEGSEDEEKRRRSRFIKLNCPHCLSRCITFSKYNLHLQSGRHMAAMRRVSIKQKSILSRMRLAQRNAQRELEKTTDDLAPRTNFCPLCKLNYKQPKSTHQASDAHKSMKKFLMPYCKVCKITFKSPMLYENHCCSIEHFKRKARAESNGEKGSDKEDDEDTLGNFMTIDSVGDVDDEESKEEEKKKEIDKKPKEQINVGIEQIRKVEVHYCDLCRMYLPRVEDVEVEKMLAKHCRHRTHLQRYVRYKEDKDLAKRAERLQRKETAEKENKEKDKDKKEEDQVNSTEDVKMEVTKEDEVKTEEEKEKPADSTLDEEEGGDDKLWADVDKDLGDILAEAESGNKSSDEDEDHAGGERYDRFRLSEKNGDDKKLKKDDEAAEVAVNGDKEEVDQVEVK